MNEMNSLFPVVAFGETDADREMPPDRGPLLLNGARVLFDLEVVLVPVQLKPITQVDHA
jgi:hypothetical protein